MPTKIRSAGNLSQNQQEDVIATFICFLTNFTELQLTNIGLQANYWWRQGRILTVGGLGPTLLGRSPPLGGWAYVSEISSNY